VRRFVSRRIVAVTWRTSPEKRRPRQRRAAAGYNFVLLVRWLSQLLRALLLGFCSRRCHPNSFENRHEKVLHGRFDIPSS
jgi:hypothetical protein